MTISSIKFLDKGGGAAALNDLENVNTGTPSNQQVLVYNSSTATWGAATPTSFSTIAMSGISDVSLSGLAQDQILIYDGSEWTNDVIYTDLIENSAITSAKIASDAVTTAKIADDAITSALIADNAVGASALNVSGNGTSGQYLISDGDGSFSWSTGPSQSGTNITTLTEITDPTTLTKADSHFVVTDDDDTGGRLSLEEAEEYLEPLNNKNIDITGYSYRSGIIGFVAGDVWIQKNNVNNQLASVNVLIYPKNQREKLRFQRVFTDDFLVEIKSGSKFFKGVVKQPGTPIPGASNILVASMELNYFLESGTFATGDSLEIKSFGSSIEWLDMKQQVNEAGRLEHPSSLAIANWFNTSKQGDSGDVTSARNVNQYIPPDQIHDAILKMRPTSAEELTYTLTWDSDGGEFGTNLQTGEIAAEPGQSYEYNLKTSDADEITMDRRMHPGARVRLETDASNYVQGRVQFADRDADNNIFNFDINPTGRTNAGTLSGTVTLKIAGALEDEMKDDEVVFYDSIEAGTGITKSAYNATNNTFTLSATGSNSLAKATKADAIGGTDNVKYMTALRTKEAIEHVGFIAQFVNLQHTTATGTAMALRRWNINADGTQIDVRGDATIRDALGEAWLDDYYFILGQDDGDTIEGQYSNPQTIDVPDNDTDVQRASISSGTHNSYPANPTLTGTWTLTIMSEQQFLAFKNMPHGVVGFNQLAASAKPGFESKTVSGQGPAFTTQNSWVVSPRRASGGADADGETTAITPANTNSVFVIDFWTLTEFNNASNAPTYDGRLQRKIGTGSWTTITTVSNIFYQLDGNPQQTAKFVDSPNTTSAVQYRMQFRKTTSAPTDPRFTNALITVEEKFK